MVNKFILPLFFFLSLANSQLSCASDEFPNDMTSEIVKKAAIQQALDDEYPDNLARVCKKWLNIIEREVQVDGDLWKIWHGIKTPEDERAYKLLRNMQLIYKPDPRSNEGIVRLSIPRGLNPFKHTFDLRSCSDIGLRVIITNDLERFFTIEDEDEAKIVVYFGPYFWVRENIDSVAALFKGIMDYWEAEKAPIGIFWRGCELGALKWFSYVTWKSTEEISAINLLMHWEICPLRDFKMDDLPAERAVSMPQFSKLHVSF